MGNAADPFEMEDGFENVPVSKASGNVVQNAAKTVVKGAANQAKKAADDVAAQLLGALYGPSTPAAPDDGQAADTTVDPATMQQTGQTQQQHTPQPIPQQVHQQQPSAGSGQQQAPQTTDEAKLQQARQELQQKHRSDYVIPTFGDISNLEMDVQKREQERKQADEQRKQEEEQKKEEQKQLEEQKKKEEVPLAVQQARTKSERRPGAG